MKSWRIIIRCAEFINSFFFPKNARKKDYCRAVPAVGGLELGGRLVRAAAAGILGHETVNMPSLRLALTSDSYRKNRVSFVTNDKEEGGWIENGGAMGSLP